MVIMLTVLLQTATFVDSFSVSSQDTAPQDLAFNTDGTKMFVVGSCRRCC